MSWLASAMTAHRYELDPQKSTHRHTHTHGGALITCHSGGDDLAKTGRVSWSTTAGMYLVGYRVAGLRSGI